MHKNKLSNSKNQINIFIREVDIMSQTLKSRISVIILITLLLSLMSTMCFAAEANATEPTKE